MASDHILKSFGDELDELTAAIAKMGAQSQSQLDSAIAALLSRDSEAAAEVVKRDLEVKDTGRFFGAHGGVLDRLDALLFTIVVGYFAALGLGYA